MEIIRRRTPLQREWKHLVHREQILERTAIRSATPQWKEKLESRVPKKVVTGLQSAFSKGFSLVFQQGTKGMEKICRTEELCRQHQDLNGAVRRYGRRKDLRKLQNTSQWAQLGNLAITTVEGIGMPDIVIFQGMLLKGIYETALRFGFSYDTPLEQLLILKMMEAAVTKGPECQRCDAEVEILLTREYDPDPEEVEAQIRRTGMAFTTEMLLVKFVQGLPLVGVLGGAANPIYYNRVLQYVQLKYQKRYLQRMAKQQGLEDL